MSSSIDSSVKLSKPFSSDTDEEKQILMQDADLYRHKLENQWEDLKDDASQYGKQALIIGGVVATTFVILNAILPDYKKKKKLTKETDKLVNRKTEPKNKGQFKVGKAVQSLAWTLAIGWARQKLTNYIADDHKPHANSQAQN